MRFFEHLRNAIRYATEIQILKPDFNFVEKEINSNVERNQ